MSRWTMGRKRTALCGVCKRPGAPIPYSEPMWSRSYASLRWHRTSLRWTHLEPYADDDHAFATNAGYLHLEARSPQPAVRVNPTDDVYNRALGPEGARAYRMRAWQDRVKADRLSELLGIRIHVWQVSLMRLRETLLPHYRFDPGVFLPTVEPVRIAIHHVASPEAPRLDETVYEYVKPPLVDENKPEVP